MKIIKIKKKLLYVILGFLFSLIFVNLVMLSATSHYNNPKFIQKVNIEHITSKDCFKEIVLNVRRINEMKRKKMSITDVYKTAEALYIGQKEYKFSYKYVASILKIESNYTPYVTSKPNKNKTVDYGIAQINSNNWNRLSKQSKKILKKYKIKYTNSKHDIYVGILNSYGYLHWSKNYLIKKNRYSSKKWIQAYNVGVSGAFSKSKKLKEKRKEYFKAFRKACMYL